MKFLIYFIIALALTFSFSTAYAVTLDLTTVGAEGYIGAGLYRQNTSQPSGTGNFDAFVRLQVGDDDTSSGYNTSGRPIPGFFTMDNSIHTHDLLLSDIPLFNINAIEYRQFLLDINEPAAANKSKLSLDDVQIYIAEDGNRLPTTMGELADLGTLIYSMDVTANNSVKLQYGLASGSGEADMALYIPNSLFSENMPYVYLFSAFGQTIGNESGFEEWGVKTPQSTNPVPEPVSLVSTIIGVIALKRFKK